jgi:hypothetical protein
MSKKLQGSQKSNFFQTTVSIVSLDVRAVLPTANTAYTIPFAAFSRAIVLFVSYALFKRVLLPFLFFLCAHLFRFICKNFRRIRCYFYANNFCLSMVPTHSNVTTKFSTYTFFNFDDNATFLTYYLFFTTHTSCFLFEGFILGHGHIIYPTITSKFLRICCFLFDGIVTFLTYALLFLRKQFLHFNDSNYFPR